MVLTMRPAMLGDLGVDQFAADRLQRRERALLVRPHQARVAGDIGGQNGRQPALDPPSWLISQGQSRREIRGRGYDGTRRHASTASARI